MFGYRLLFFKMKQYYCKVKNKKLNMQKKNTKSDKTHDS
jgi:hypothetical protein